MEREHRTGLGRMVTLLVETFGLSYAAAWSASLLIVSVLMFGVFWFVHAAPPRSIVITSGTPGSSFETNAYRYKQILARSGVKVKILASQGSIENLQRLEDPSVDVDVGFVQGGISNGPNTAKLVSLGSISYQPLLIFHRGTNSLSLLSEFTGKRLAVGAAGSGTRMLAMTLLGLNGIKPGGPTELL
ncbi:MAG TPA: TAXI family TRAP transporter solute-binding subunit, partial [Verrucomicrobiae bacterium]|nr:TAXI family TRAP transporter solute-binding subunit [Verrucomicrobiae bacterium]